MTAREALEIATLGGARVLGRSDIGAIAPGMAADMAAFDLEGIGFAGGLHDPVAALVFCAGVRASLAIIDGREVVREGRLAGMDLRSHVAEHNDLARELVDG
jgi:8-oxoguanine deaminase